jgi:plastocyanin
MRLLLLLALLGASAAPAAALVNLPPEVGVGVHDVRIAGSAYHPQVLVVGLGSTVTWANDDDQAHTASDLLTQGWDSGNIPSGEARSVTFGAPGVWVYMCAYHSNMVGVLVVAAEP